MRKRESWISPSWTPPIWPVLPPAICTTPVTASSMRITSAPAGNYMKMGSRSRSKLSNSQGYDRRKKRHGEIYASALCPQRRHVPGSESRGDAKGHSEIYGLAGKTPHPGWEEVGRRRGARTPLQRWEAHSKRWTLQRDQGSAWRL